MHYATLGNLEKSQKLKEFRIPFEKFLLSSLYVGKYVDMTCVHLIKKPIIGVIIKVSKLPRDLLQ